ncbi:MAG: class I SAM-dependent methyltransferase [Sphingobacteriales bacterium JAD_PAG50586_3]|nr:MAG: class I SAM-dependent methyltransferase [Sphingobacteriales bacterium JAD_PAG50586_3]
MKAYFFNDARIKSAHNEVEVIVKTLGLNGTEKIVDLFCGIGRHTNILALQGYETLGVDFSNSNIISAKKTAQQLDSSAKFIKCDILKFYGSEKFDVALMLWNSFGYYTSIEQNNIVLKNAYNTLNSNGTLCIETEDKEYYNLSEYSVKKTIDNFKIVKKIKVQDNILNCTWQIFDGKQTNNYTITKMIFSKKEYLDMLTKIGFSSIRIIAKNMKYIYIIAKK